MVIIVLSKIWWDTLPLHTHPYTLWRKKSKISSFVLPFYAWKCPIILPFFPLICRRISFWTYLNNPIRLSFVPIGFQSLFSACLWRFPEVTHQKRYQFGAPSIKELPPIKSYTPPFFLPFLSLSSLSRSKFLAFYASSFLSILNFFSVSYLF